MKKAVAWFRGTKKTTKATLVSLLLVGVLVSATSASPNPSSQPVDQPKAQSTTPQEDVKREPIVTYMTETETRPMPFQKATQNDPSLAKGQSYIKIAGVDGVITTTYNITLTDNSETAREKTEKVTTKPITQVTVVGTYVKPAPVAPSRVSSCDSNYSGCVPVVSYDLDCSDIRSEVRVIGSDVHGLDRDNDGYGCESY